MSHYKKLFEQRKFNRSEKKCRQELRRNPDNLEARLTLVRSLHEQAKTDAVVHECQTAVKRKLPAGDKAVFFNLAGNALQKSGRQEAALTFYRRADESWPGHPSILINKVKTLFELNRLSECVGVLDEIASCQRQPDDETTALAVYYRSQADKEATAGRLLQDFPAAQKNISSSYYHSGMGELHEREGNYSQALLHFNQSNSLLRQSSRYEFEQELILFSVYSELFDADFFSEPAFEWEPASTVPMFVVGMPRSGTSLVEQMLGSHSQVEPLGEVDWMQQFTMDEQGRKKTFLPLELKQQMLSESYCRKVREAYLSHLEGVGARYAVDKLPANLQLLWAIHRVFPESLVIHTVREKWPTCWSCYKAHFRSGNHFSESLEDCSNYHDAMTELTGQWGPLMGDRYFRIVYEEFVADPRQCIDRLLSHLELDIEEQCYDPSLNKRIVHTASRTQVMQPVYQDANRGWEQYRDLLDEKFPGMLSDESLQQAL